MILRRSRAPAIAPPQSPHTTIGTNSVTLTRPTARWEPVNSFICGGTAIGVRKVPNIVMTPEPKSSRKSRESRRGLRSVARWRSGDLIGRSVLSGPSSKCRR